MRITFKEYPEIIAGISEFSDGSMVWWNRKPVDEKVLKNRNVFFVKNGIDPKKVVTGGVAHQINVMKAGAEHAGEYFLNTDVLITNTLGLFLTVTAADCMPIFFYDPTTKSVGVAHAGWKGLVKGILENTIFKFQKELNSEPRNLLVQIGPHIQVCHFEVGNEVVGLFNSKNIEIRNGYSFANLSGEAIIRLKKAGVRNIQVSSVCAFCDSERFYSARRDKSNPLKGMAAYIGLSVGSPDFKL